MARRPRISIAGYPLHVVVRANDRQLIFLSEGDRIFCNRVLAVASRGEGALIHAYVFMSNHVHLLMTGKEDASISKAIQSLGRRYVPYFNFIHRRTGTLWEGRFRSSPVESDEYFLACQRYIELNPVRAGICKRPGDFPWSSHRYYATGRADDLVTPHSIHELFGQRIETRAAAYRAMFPDRVPDDVVAHIRDSLHQGRPLGKKVSAVNPLTGV
jgi:putative transposase